MVWRSPDSGMVWRSPDSGMVWRSPDSGMVGRAQQRHDRASSGSGMLRRNTLNGANESDEQVLSRCARRIRFPVRRTCALAARSPSPGAVGILVQNYSSDPPTPHRLLRLGPPGGGPIDDSASRARAAAYLT